MENFFLIHLSGIQVAIEPSCISKCAASMLLCDTMFMYSEMTHVELKSTEGDPYYKFPEFLPGSLEFHAYHDQSPNSSGKDVHLLTQFPSTVGNAASQ
jgi:hypothetical protein